VRGARSNARPYRDRQESASPDAGFGVERTKAIVKDF